jgi:hypothetical protein
MAGLLFTNEKVFLAGYKKFKGHITGIGGKQKEGETILHTAFRETIEELFGIREVEERVICIMENVIIPYRSLTTEGYTHFLCDISDLRLFLSLSYLEIKKSPFYDVFPTMVDQLLFERKNTERAEISHLCLLPFVEDSRIARHLINDINLCVMPVSTM